MWRALLLLLLVAASSSQDNEISSGDSELIPSSGSGASGSGSGDDETPTTPPTTPLDCNATESHVEYYLADKVDVVREANCHVACLEKVMEANNVDLKRAVSGVWLSVPTAALHSTCYIYQQVYECRSGCLLSRDSADENLCITECYDNCIEYSSNLPDSGCQRKCSNVSCEVGCTINNDIPDDYEWPVLPRGELNVERHHESRYLHGAGVFRLHYNVITPPPASQPLTTAYVVEVSVQDEKPIYYWMSSLEDPLKMDSFLVCRTVLVTFFPVNKFGNSDLSSDPVSVVIYEDNWPSLPNHPSPYTIQYTAVDDSRSEYVGHSVITVTWGLPNRHQYLTGYRIDFTSPNKFCGSSKSYVIEKEDGPSFTWISEGPRAAPVCGCEYVLKVSSLPTEDNFPGDAGSHNLAVPDFSSPLSSTNILSCTRAKGSNYYFIPFYGSLDIEVSWTIPNNVALWRGLEDFKMERLMKSVTSGLVVDRHEYDPVDYKYRASWYSITPYQPYTSVDTSYLFVLHVQYSDGHQPFLHSNYSCEVDGRLFQPSPPSTVTVNTLELTDDGELSLETVWDPSTDRVNEYILYVGLVPLSGEVQPKQTDLDQAKRQVQSSSYVIPESAILWLEWHDFDANNITDEYDIDLENLGSGYIGDIVLYVQMVSIDRLRSSNWTTPIAVNVTVDRVVGKVSSSHRPTATITSTHIPSSILPSSTVILNDEKQGYSNVVTIVTATAPVVFFLIVAIVVVFTVMMVAFVKNRRLRLDEEMLNKHSMKDGFNFSLGLHGSFLDHWEVSPNDVTMERYVGEGSYGEVYKGSFTQKIPHKKEGEDIVVLVKYLRTSATPMEHTEFDQQLHQYKMSSTAGDPYILQMLGCISTTQPSCAVLEYPEGGDLLTHLVRLRDEIPSPSNKYLNMSLIEPAVDLDSNTPKFDFIRGLPLSPALILKYTQQIASAMDCLSGLGIIHKDLACRNVYLDENHTIKVTDLGVAPLCRRDHVYPMGLPLRWMALESILDHTYTTATDVWAFGVTMWEIVTFGGFPYQDIKNERMSSFLQGGNRLPQPLNCSTELYTILNSCWDSDPNRRPSFQLLHETLVNQLQDADNLLNIEIPLLKTNRPISPLSSDSAIGDCPQSPEMGMVIEVHNGIPMVTNPGYRRDSFQKPMKSTTFVAPTSDSNKKSPHLEKPRSLMSHDQPMMDDNGATEV